MNDFDIFKLKKQHINDAKDLGDTILIKTTNFEIVINKNNIRQFKKIEEYPKILDYKVTKFDGYEKIESIYQKSKKNKTYQSCIYFPKIDYSFDIVIEDIRPNDTVIFCEHLLNNIKELNNIDIEILTDIVKKFIIKKDVPYGVYTANEKYLLEKTKPRESNVSDGFILTDIGSYGFVFRLLKGKILYPII